MSRTSSRRLAHLLAALGVVVSLAVTTVPAHAAPATTKARHDKVRVVSGGAAKTVEVLANDRLAGARSRAKVKVVRKPAGFRTRVTASKRVKVRATAGVRPGRYTITYAVTSKQRKARAKVVVTVVRKKSVKPTTPTSSPRPTSRSTPSPTATVTPRPSATLSPTPSPTPTRSPAAPGAATNATPLLDLIAQLAVAAEVTSGYDRDDWRHWNAGAIPDDGCDTRSEVLLAEAVTAVAAGTRCPLTSSNSGGGSWYSYYDGVTTTSPSTFDIDHMVPLAEAHRSGGHAWSAATREAYANDLGDPRSLVAVSASSNRAKSDGDPAEWLPDLELCRYVSEWVAVKTRWSLSVDPTEKSALTEVATEECSSDTVVIVAPAPTASATPTTAPSPTATPTTGGTDPRFGSCKEAKQHGYGPYRRGVDPEYDWYRDGDGDGIVCE